ncbi:hypothetical protein H0I29_16535 [Polaribacter sp. R2A056_3_33]|uniref:hypothetical protein n=1 Tax=Polaribacter sp. R2A056_3_33 TaxID=2745563 RepID=UPI001C4F8894|nr:hypothetical protein [Polaribacter sp. R2A056_3_33]QXP70202.1 hypothetical protein H0I29_16535 [Polaribacter sp. R2A056_3_33]
MIKNFSVLMIFLLMSNTLFAHQPDLSNIVISKTDNGQVILQINSSLTAFQQEVNFVNGEGFYKSPEEFRNLVIKHFNSRFSMIINKKDTLQFKNPKVFLGHETKLVVEIIGLPETINSIQLKNTLFKDIYHSQSIVIFLLEQFPTQKFSLDVDNKYQINLALKKGNWENILEEKMTSNFKYVGYFAILLVISVVFLVIKRKKTVK